jgi:dolichyl-diphosphooligosaccharide--protein glycosyltransferase
MLVLAPVMCILAGIAISSTLHTYMKNLDVSQKQGGKLAKGGDRNYPYKNEV